MRIAVIGAGFVGVEAALAASRAGHEVVVFEAGDVGHAALGWGHVTLFTPWRMNTTEAGRALLADPVLGGESCPTGRQIVERYLRPLAARLDVRPRHRVLGIGRSTVRKGDMDAAARAADPFQLHVRGPTGAFLATADVVLDCSGTWSSPAPAGIGGLDAPGEPELREAGRIAYGPVPVDALSGRRVALVGEGASAATVLLDLLRVGAAVTWITLREEVPSFVSPEDDPLRGRRALYERARAARRRVAHVAGRRIVGFSHDEDVLIRLDDGETLRTDHVVACTGFRPDLALHRELQVHACWASEGPMRLAAALGGGGDCLAEQASGPDLLRNPEPRFFVLGSKSYGRRSDFLLRTGHRQVDEALALLAAP